MKCSIFLLVFLLPILCLAQFEKPEPIPADAKFLKLPDFKNKVHVTLHPELSLLTLFGSQYIAPENNDPYFKEIEKSQTAFKEKLIKLGFDESNDIPLLLKLGKAYNWPSLFFDEKLNIKSYSDYYDQLKGNEPLVQQLHAYLLFDFKTYAGNKYQLLYFPYAENLHLPEIARPKNKLGFFAAIQLKLTSVNYQKVNQDCIESGWLDTTGVSNLSAKVRGVNLDLSEKPENWSASLAKNAVAAQAVKYEATKEKPRVGNPDNSTLSDLRMMLVEFKSGLEKFNNNNQPIEFAKYLMPNANFKSSKNINNGFQYFCLLKGYTEYIRDARKPNLNPSEVMAATTSKAYSFYKTLVNDAYLYEFVLGGQKMTFNPVHSVVYPDKEGNCNNVFYLATNDPFYANVHVSFELKHRVDFYQTEYDCYMTITYDNTRSNTQTFAGTKGVRASEAANAEGTGENALLPNFDEAAEKGMKTYLYYNIKTNQNTNTTKTESIPGILKYGFVMANSKLSADEIKSKVPGSWKQNTAQVINNLVGSMANVQQVFVETLIEINDYNNENAKQKIADQLQSIIGKQAMSTKAMGFTLIEQ